LKSNQSIKIVLLFLIIILFFVSAVTPITFGCNVSKSDEEMIKVEDYNFDRHFFPEYYNHYSIGENYGYITIDEPETKINQNSIESKKTESFKRLTNPLNDSMDSAWPMHGHDVRHTGLSPYNTANNPGEEKWWFKTERNFIEGSPVIDTEGIIYFGSWDNNFYAVYPNGSLKWSFEVGGNVESSPAIAEDGTIYVGTHFALVYGTYLFAINPDGTLKWKYKTGDMYSSPAIGDDGTIYFGDGGNGIVALYPNGNLKWRYETGEVVMSSPAIDDDGIIYCGSHDNYVYALYPNNGTLKWKFNTGGWVHGIPTIGDDGTVYIGSDNGYMYALYPNNGTMRWRCYIGAVWASPALDKDGNLYVGVWDKKFYAIYPNGVIKWSIELSRRVWGMSAAISDEGTIYFGTCDFEGHDGGYLYALNPNGTIKWILYHTRMFFTSPAIGEDGTLYICTRQDEFTGTGYVATGHLRALNDLDPNAPKKPSISGPKEGKPGIEYEYTFKSTSPLGKDVFYYIDWGDQMNTGWLGPYSSGKEVQLKHSWRRDDAFKIRVKTKDVSDLWGPWGEFDVVVSNSRDKAVYNTFFLKILDQFPLLGEFLSRIANT